MNNVYNTACHKDDVLDGWIMGSAGAVRYRLPPNLDQASIAMTDIYGYLLATVAPDGKITFQFKDINESDVPCQRGQRIFARAGEVVLRAEQVQLHARRA